MVSKIRDKIENKPLRFPDRPMVAIIASKLANPSVITPDGHGGFNLRPSRMVRGLRYPLTVNGIRLVAVREGEGEAVTLYKLVRQDGV